MCKCGIYLYMCVEARAQPQVYSLVTLYLAFWDRVSQLGRADSARLVGQGAPPLSLSHHCSHILHLFVGSGGQTHILLLAWRVLY